MTPRVLAALLIGALIASPGAALSAQCTPGFDVSPGVPGFDLEVFAFERFGAGTHELYAGGRFKKFGATPIHGLARWTGTAWQAVGAGVAGGPVPAVRALLAGDDGSGPSLFVGGDFSSIDGVPAGCIARFDGEHFHAIGNGLPAAVNALALYDAGSGPRLYAGTDFTDSSVPGGVYRFEAGTWSLVAGGVAVGPGNNAGSVDALAVYGSGRGELYAGGIFVLAGGIAATYIARFDGTAWRDVNGGMDEPVHTMATFDDGTGPQLFCGGTFLHAGAPAVPATHAARWNGSSWNHLGNTNPFEFFGIIGAIESFDDGSGPALYLAGVTAFVPTPVFRWDGGPAWTPLATTLSGRVYAMATLPDGLSNDLFLGGMITAVGAAPVAGAARYRGCPLPPASLKAITPPQLGTDLVLHGSSPGGAGRPYFCGFAFSSRPGIQLAQGTQVPLAIDQLLLLSLDAANVLFDDQFGTLDADSSATVRLHLPPLPIAAGIDIVASLIVFGAGEPDGIHAVSPALALTLSN